MFICFKAMHTMIAGLDCVVRVVQWIKCIRRWIPKVIALLIKDKSWDLIGCYLQVVLIIWQMLAENTIEIEQIIYREGVYSLPSLTFPLTFAVCRSFPCLCYDAVYSFACNGCANGIVMQSVGKSISAFISMTMDLTDSFGLRDALLVRLLLCEFTYCYKHPAISS